MRNEHFITVETWEAAAPLLDFAPRSLPTVAGRALQKLEIYVRDLKRELPPSERVLEARFPGVAFAQTQKPTEKDARDSALGVSYGQDPEVAFVGGHEARIYELGPEVPPDDIDGRSSSVVTWTEGRKFYLLASSELMAADLLEVAKSLYPDG